MKLIVLENRVVLFIAIEIKMGSTFQSDFGRHLRYFMQCGEGASEEPIKNYVLYTGDQEGLCHTIERIPIKKIHSLFDEPELL